MVIALTQPVQGSDQAFVSLDKDNLQLEVKLSVSLEITAEQAKRKVTRFLIDEVSLLIHPQPPLLVVSDQNTIFWRFPLVFSMGHRGKLGQVGEVDVNARTGQLLLNDDLISEIKAHARILAQSTALSQDNDLTQCLYDKRKTLGKYNSS
jgi:hypothetical protein